MAGYKFGKSKIRENNYDVYLRIHHSDWEAKPVDVSYVHAMTDGSITTVNHFIDETSVKSDGETPIIYTVADTNIAWFKIGKCEEKPIMKEAVSTSKKTNDGDELFLRREAEVTFKDLEISKDNLNVLDELCLNYQVDVLYVDTSEIASTSTDNAYAVANMSLNVSLDVVGNDLNIVTLSGKRSEGIAKRIVTPIDVKS